MMYIRPPVADLLAEPEPRAERVSQLLCFTPCEVLEEKGEFFLVRGPDGYRGWVRRSHLSPGSPPAPSHKVSWPIVPVVDPRNRTVIFRLCLDTRFAGEPTASGVEVRLPTGEVGIVPADAVKPVSWHGSIEDLIELGLALRGVPYLWGGTSSFGTDCSGLIQRLFHFVFNLWLPRDSRDQAGVGKPVGESEDLLPGDLLFFPGHVALYIGDGKALHASAREGMVVSGPLSSLPQEFLGARRIPTGPPGSPRGHRDNPGT